MAPVPAGVKVDTNLAGSVFDGFNQHRHEYGRRQPSERD